MFGKRFTRALVVTATASLIMATAAFADDLKVDLDAQPTDTTITEGGSTTASYLLTAQRDGGEPTTGTPVCNASSTQPVTVNIASNPAAGLTITPSSFQLTGCGGSNGMVVTFDGDDPGVYSLTATTSGGNGNTITVTQAAWTLTVVEDSSSPADTTDPTIFITTPANGATYLRGQVIVADYECADELGGSGLASCVGTVADGAAIDTSTLGTKTFIVNAADNAGNTAQESVSYTVALSITGFDRPVDMNMRNVAKAGQTIPLKFSVSDALGPVTDLTASDVLVKVATLACDPRVPTDSLESEAASGNSGLQNLGGGFYQFNWSTPKGYANSCKTMTLSAGFASKAAEFEFKK